MENAVINQLTDVIAARNWENTSNRGVIERIEKNLGGKADNPVTLTHLQKTALNHPDFWSKWDDRNPADKDLIIQGATSGGKTLLSELSILDCLSHGKKALVLVPLKALVHERYKQFIRDLAPNGEYNIYASSSDYLDMDERLIGGEYQVGILVYEKLFAMLCQDHCMILDNCSLIVVDELSMLGKDERGPKLEIALEKAKTYTSSTTSNTVAVPPRIMCLTTTDNEVDRISEWLGTTHESYRDGEAVAAESVAVISDPIRPVGLDEYIVTYDGKYKMRSIPGEQDTFCEEKISEGRFQVSDNNLAESSARRQDLLVEILRTLYEQKPGMKTLIFVPSQTGVASLAKKLLEKLPGTFTRIELEKSMSACRADESTESLWEELKNCDADEDLKNNRDRFLPYGIAYHHGSMGTTLREVIEEYFRQSPDAKVIIATETLTVGVNMPIDTMIITDYLIPKGQDERHALTNQEYRNYIGRAGRLGMSERGRSYLLVPSNELKTKYWDDKYRSHEQITSALTNVRAKTMAPYYLNLLAGQASFDQEDVTRRYHASLSYICNRRRNLNTNEIIDLLKKNGLARKRGETEDDVPQYILTDMGRTLAAYALSLDTVKLLQRVFVEKYDQKKAEEYGAGMPADITADDIKNDRYLLDILFWICEDSEVKNSHLLQLPGLTGSGSKGPEIRGKIYKALYTLLEDEELQRLGAETFRRDGDALPERCYLWKESAIEKAFFSDDLPDWETMQRGYRAIVLFYWTKGKSVSQIKKAIDLSAYRVRCNGGDLEQFAEAVSYHLDAAAHLVQYNKNFHMLEWVAISRLERALCNLSSRVKYGLQADAIIVANRHVHGLDRSRILMLSRAAAEHGMNTLDYLRAAPVQETERWITRQQRMKLLRLLQNRYSEGSLEARLKMLEGDYSLDSQVCASLRSISVYKQDTPEELFKELSYVLGNAPENCLQQCSALNTTQNTSVRKWSCFGISDTSVVYIAYLYADDEKLSDEEKQRRIDKVQSFFGAPEQKDAVRILLAGHDSAQPLYDAANKGMEFTLGITCDNLAALILSSIWLGKSATSKNTNAAAGGRPIMSRGSADLLFDVLQDTRGIPLNLSLSNTNYTPESFTGEPMYQILLNQNDGEGSISQQLCNSLLADDRMNQFRLLPWGKTLEKEIYVSHPTIILLNPNQIQCSYSLTRFLYRMEQGRFENCLVLAANAADQAAWNKPIRMQNAMKWSSANSHCKVQAVETVQQMKESIRLFVDGWEKKKFLVGISYAHYDGTDASDKAAYRSDVAALHKLVDLLNQQYGEQRVLFDENPTCNELGLFCGDHSRAKAAYQECCLVLMLDNGWTRDNENCRKERIWVKARVDAGLADLWLLQTGGAHNPSPASGQYTTLLPSDDVQLDHLVKNIDARIKELCGAAGGGKE